MQLNLDRLVSGIFRMTVAGDSVTKRALSFVLFFMIVGSAFAEQNTNPHINRHYQDADVEQWRDVFESDGREVWDRRYDIIKALDLKTGQRVADVGAGTGFFSLIMAEKVGPEGKVYAVDISKNFVDGVMERAKQAGFKNMIGVVNDQKSVRLPDASVDLVFISDTYHHFEYPITTLKTIHSALIENGEVVVIDYRKIPGRSSSWVMGHVRGGRQQVIKEFESEGFELVEDLDFMGTQFYLRFRKTS